VIILFPMMGNMEEKKASLSIPGFWSSGRAP
jgi:hypothetical protein